MLLFVVFVVTVIPVIILVGGAALVYLQEMTRLPTPQATVLVSESRGVTRLYDRSGQTLIFAVSDPLGDARQWMTLDELPGYVTQATLLVEDPDFLTATRFDPFRTLTRLWRNILNGPVEMETTLTARLIRNAIAPPADYPRVSDRMQEIVLTSEVNRLYTPQEILEWHLNTNDYGGAAYGIEAAARIYLGKSARDLTLDEAALLASIPTAPEFNPIDNEAAARGRQSDTLRRMLIAGLITQAEYDSASRMQTVLLPNAGLVPEVAPDFSLYARQQAETILDGLGMNGDRLIMRGGLTITTTLDLDLYYQSECALRAHLARLAAQTADIRTLNDAACLADDGLLAAAPMTAPPDTGAIVILEAETGEIRALLGRAAHADYQPAVMLAPVVYFEGFRDPQQGIIYTPATMMLDIPRRFPGVSENLIYTPANPDNQFSGPVSLREAASQGLLPPLVQIAYAHGMNSILQTAHRMGINSMDTGLYHPQLLESGGEAALLDLTYTYSVFATLGKMTGVVVEPRALGFRNRDPVAVTRITDSSGAVLWEYDPDPSQVTVFSPELGYLVNNVFADSEQRFARFGPNNALTVTGRSAAVVTGASSDNIDQWSVGYTPQHVVGVYLGRADFSPMSVSGYGLDGAATVWRALMEYVHRELPATDWERPETIIEGAVCQRSGLLPNGVCPTRRELFISGLVPTQIDSYWQVVTINSQTRQRASVSTPDNLRVSQTYFIPPEDAMDWWVANNLELPPDEVDTLSRPENSVFSSTTILQPEDFAYVRGLVDVRGIVNTTGMQSYQLAYGEGVSPTEWFTVGATQTSFNPEDNLLAEWDTTGLDAPLYTLELSVLMSDGSRERDFVQVRIDNTPPTVILTAGEANRIYRWPDETIIPLTAEVNDNFAVSRVEFYHNGRLLDVVTLAPYSYDFSITRTGTEFFRAIAYDAAGNQQESTEISVEIAR